MAAAAYNEGVAAVIGWALLCSGHAGGGGAAVVRCGIGRGIVARDGRCATQSRWACASYSIAKNEVIAKIFAPLITQNQIRSMSKTIIPNGTVDRRISH